MHEWEGLWYCDAPRAWRERLVPQLLVYLGVPLALALIFSSHSDPFIEGVMRSFPRTFIVSACVAGSFDVQYRYLWPFVFGKKKPTWPLRIGGHVAAIAIAVLAGGALAAWLLELLMGYPASELREILWRQATVISTVVIGLLVTTDELRARVRAHERKATEARVALLRAELSALQARTDPHFLFNSLNTVAALIPDDASLAETVLERLAVVFRYALDAGRRETVTLVEEIAAVQAYLEVEALRLGERLVWRVERDGEFDGVTVPPLVLQPLAENAIRHGAGTRLGATELIVTVRRDANRLVLAVEDLPSGPQRGSAARPSLALRGVTGGAGVAVDDLRKRLALTYGDRATLEAGPHDGGWRAEIAIAL